MLTILNFAQQQKVITSELSLFCTQCSFHFQIIPYVELSQALGLNLSTDGQRALESLLIETIDKVVHSWQFFTALI